MRDDHREKGEAKQKMEMRKGEKIERSKRKERRTHQYILTGFYLYF